MKKKPIFIIIIFILFFFYSFISMKDKLSKNIDDLEKQILYNEKQAENYKKNYKEIKKRRDELELEVNDKNKKIELLEKSNKKTLSYIKCIKKYSLKEYLIQYKKITNKSIYDYYTEDEISYMCRCVETEVYQGDFNSKINVASIILNRKNDCRFPNNIIEVITTKNQFSYSKTKISKETKLAIEYAILIGDTTNGCISFRSDACPSRWCGWNYIFTDNVGHNFYK